MEVACLDATSCWIVAVMVRLAYIGTELVEVMAAAAEDDTWSRAVYSLDCRCSCCCCRQVVVASRVSVGALYLGIEASSSWVLHVEQTASVAVVEVLVA